MEYHSGGSLPLLGRPRYCPGANANGGYLCETGHCCGETGCCTYYYELWWFWLLWTVLILFSCCCAYRHRRAKLRVQQQQRQREISLLAYHGASSYPSSMLDLSFLASLKLPSYEEVAAQPSTPPPPYSSVFTAPRYPQPPRTTDPHLLTQHGPLLHQPLSDGPSSLSSDNSSSCSCDSCCPSSPCSSSLSAPVTYETDTSHASTPSEATPLALDVTMETISAAASRLESTRAPFASGRRKSATVAIDIEEPLATEINPASKQTVTVAVVARSASPLDTSSPNSDPTLPVGITPPIKQQLDLTPTNGSPTSLQSPSNNTALPCIQSTAALKSNSPTPTSCPPTSLNITRTSELASSSTSPQQARTFTLILDSAGATCPNKIPSLIPTAAPSNLTQSPGEGTSSFTSNSGTISTSPIHVQSPETNLHSSPGEGTATFTPTSQTVHSKPSPSQSPGGRPSPSAPALGSVATNISQSSIPVLSCLLSPSQGIPIITSDLTEDFEEGLSNLNTNPSPEVVSSEIKSLGAIVTKQMPEIESTDPVPSLVNAFQESARNQEAVVTKSTKTIATDLTPTSATLGTSLTKSIEEVPLSLLQIPKTVSKDSDPSLENLTSVSVQIPVLISSHLDLTQFSDSEPDRVTQATKSSPDSAFNALTGSEFTLNVDAVISPSMFPQEPEPSPNPSCQISDLPKQTEAPTASKSCSVASAPSDLDCVVFPPSQDLTGANCQAVGALNLDPKSVKSFSIAESVPNPLSKPNVSPKMAMFNKSLASDTSIALPTFVQNLDSLPEPTRDLSSPKSSLSQQLETPDVSGSPLGLPSPSLNSENTENLPNPEVPPASDNFSFCPAITIQADPPSFAASPTSPSSIPSPTPPSPPVSTLLLDPLSALNASDKSGASSGHASSLSPSPRNTQSPPKQTLFSPCVDVFEPVNPNWEDDEDEEQQDDEDYDDDDMGADESQYRHRRLTGDSGIEVCRCRMEDEDEDDEKLESEKDREKSGTVEKKLGGSTELHDSVDCPVRGQKSTGDELTLCNTASDTTPTSDDNVVIPLETV